MTRQWQQSTDDGGVTYTDISGATGAPYTTAATTYGYWVSVTTDRIIGFTSQNTTQGWAPISS
jgi:hypothetical protein